MKYLAALPLAAVFAIGLASGAQAWGVVPSDYKAPVGMNTYYDDAGSEPVHRCHGRSAGTASPACGTISGGPVGGLH